MTGYQDKLSVDENLKTILEWVDAELFKGVVPRVTDVYEYAYKTLGFTHLKKSQIAKALRLHKSYMMTSSQQREPKRSLKYRSIISNTLGNLHADIGFFGLSRDYETPVTYRAGFLIATDVLSKFKYGVILRKNRTAPSMIKAFNDLLEQHNKQFPNGHLIKSVSFDKETSVSSKLVQNFFKENNIAFHSFGLSSSKAKLAENTIRYFRNSMKRLLIQNPDRRWWNLFDTCIEMMNNQPIQFRHKLLKWRPVDINIATLNDFLKDLYKEGPVLYHTQFVVYPGLVNFKYPLGTLVRIKKIYSSSAVLGEKRSEVTLDSNIFKVLEHIAYLTKASTIAKAYKCIDIQTHQEEVFDEYEIAETRE